MTAPRVDVGKAPILGRATSSSPPEVGRVQKTPESRRRPRVSALTRRRQRFLILLLSPTILFAAIVLVYPLYLMIDASIHSVNILNIKDLNSGPLTAANYKQLGNDPQFKQSLWVTFLYTTATTIAAFAIGLGLAVLLNKRFPLRRFYRKLILLPWAVPAVVAGYLFVWMFNASYGVIDYILVRLHITSTYLPWLASDRWALVAVIIPTVWKFYPFFCLLILGALQVVPPEYYEAAQLDGAGSWKQFAHITWPAIRPMAFFAIVLGAFGIFGEFSIIYPMTGGGPGGSTQTLGIYMYNQAFQLFHMGYASALGMLMFGLCIVLVLVTYPRLRKTLWR